MVLDDIGFADTGINSKSNIPLPHLLQLAKDGVVLDNYYTQTVCSPTRSALMTGLFPFRFGMQHPTTVLPSMTAGVPLDVPMLPELLRKQGYERHAIGKWHCGYATWDHTPTGRGFQSHTGYFQAQGDYFKHDLAIPDTGAGLDFWVNQRPARELVGNYSLDVYRHAQAQVLIQYARKHATPEERSAHPLFVYLAHQTVHIPLEPRTHEGRCDHLQQKGSRKTYCSMLVELDDAVGELVQLYKDLGLWDNTIVLTTTDNGGMVNWAPLPTSNDPTFPASAGSNYPLRGGKTTMYEGGVRAMAFVSGPQVPTQARGTRFKGLMHTVDLSAAVLTLAGVLPLQREVLNIDGINFLPGIFGIGPQAGRTEVPINILEGGRSYSAVRFFQYKVIIDQAPASVRPSQGWYDENGDLLQDADLDNEAPIRVYDLENDPQERVDLSASHPYLIEHAHVLLRSYIEGGKYHEPQRAFVHLDALPVLHEGVWAPFMTRETWERQLQREWGLSDDEDEAMAEEEKEEEEREAQVM